MLDCDDAIHSPLNVERQTGRRKEMTTLVEHGRECEVLAESIQTSSLRKFSEKHECNASRYRVYESELFIKVKNGHCSNMRHLQR